MKYLIIISILLGSISHSTACECDFRSLLDEVSYSEKIYIGTVVSQESENFKIEVLRTYKGNLDFDDYIDIKTGENNCDYSFLEIGKSYLIYQEENNKNISICSRTKEFYFSKDFEHLERIYPNNETNPNSVNLLRDLVDEKTNEIRLNDNSSINIKDKSILFFDGKQVLTKGQLSESQIFLYPMQFVLIDSNSKINNCLFDYLVYVKIAHQSIRMSEKLKLKLKKKISKKTCR